MNARGERRIHADHAAGSFPKPACVVDAIAAAASRLHSPGRGAYRESLEAAGAVETCRARVASVLGASDPTRVVLTAGQTDSLNMVIKGVTLQRRRMGLPAHVVATTLEHNAVLRPLKGLEAWGVRHALVPPRGHAVTPQDIAAAIEPDTCLVVVTHASNVTGAIQPVRELAVLCREKGVVLLVDAAQTAGHLPVDVEKWGVDVLAAPGHKGLLGPQGIAALFVRAGVEDRIDPWREGGTGGDSATETQPRAMPTRFEAGTMNLLGAAGLAAGVDHLRSLRAGVETARSHDLSISAAMLAAIGSGRLGEFRLEGPLEPEARVPVFSLRHPRLDAAEAAAMLESHFGILCRAGLACAPRATGSSMLRVSFGLSTTLDEVEAVIAALGAVGSN
jgi:selenocysteine lyase/cysteine desulfurase